MWSYRLEIGAYADADFEGAPSLSGKPVSEFLLKHGLTTA
jgi:hypothetical protein